MISYLDSVRKQFEYYKSIGDKTFEQLSFEELKIQFTQDSNSISIIVKHLVGNMLSRWTNFLTEDGEKEWRQRDKEFIDNYSNKEDLFNSWNKGWSCLFNTLDAINNNDLNHIVYIRNQGHTVTEALNRQMMHYAYHIGQIVYIGKLVKGKDWKSLSISKGESKTYNQEKFAKDKGQRHFTEDL
ncbi:DUF1572 family protein [Winogradskyella sp. KYW1333]|uniref:DUF1572 family protein n=1 Tax=Winogradskyella sp. KYW1333 TaxID=2282123 RepID=UPI000DF3BFC1|nr:DUF1572 family protein [Winogradskyella sp. KYW1333]RCT54534.1 DUF1572 domain-containing protein [Winogradskyella sp. KYW1333]